MIGTPADQRDTFPIYTYLMHAGLSPADVRQAGDEITRRVREVIRQKAINDDPDAARRYQTDPEHRAEVNEQIVAEVVLGMGFDIRELRKLEQAMRIAGLAPREEAGRMVARTIGPTGLREDFEFLERGAHPVLRSLRDGTIHRF